MCRKSIRRRTAAKSCVRGSRSCIPARARRMCWSHAAALKRISYPTWALMEPGDEIVFMLPNYMQIRGVAESLWRDGKAAMAARKAGMGNRYVDELRQLVTQKTKLIAICNPNNPTGSVLREDEREAIVAAAAKVGAWVIADEVYRGAEAGRRDDVRVSGAATSEFCARRDSRRHTACPGLRTGWVVGAGGDDRGTVESITITPASVLRC